MPVAPVMSAPVLEVSLWRNRDFNTFWAGQALSALGDAFASIAVPLLVLQATGSLQRMGMLTATVSVAHVVSGLFSGALVDRVDRRRLMIACDVGRWALWSVVPVAWWMGGPSYPLLVAASCAAALLGNTFQVTAITAVASLVPRSQLIHANGRMHGAYAAMFFVGPMLAGVVCERWGPVVALCVDAASFLASALSVVAVRGRFARDATAPREAPVGVVAGFVQGLRFLWANPTLRATMLLLCVSSLLLAGRDNMLVYYIKRDLHRGDRAVGAVFAAGALGALAGAVLAPRMRARWGFAACWLAAGASLGAATMGFGVVTALAALGALGAVVGFSETVRGINTMTLRQEVTPDALLGRVTAAFWSVLTVPAALGAAWTTTLAERLGVRPVISALGLAVVLLMVVGSRTALARHARA